MLTGSRMLLLSRSDARSLDARRSDSEGRKAGLEAPDSPDPSVGGGEGRNLSSLPSLPKKIAVTRRASFSGEGTMRNTRLWAEGRRENGQRRESGEERERESEM